MKKYVFITIGVVILVVLLDFVFSSKIILPQSFSFGPLKIHYYGIIMALAVLAAYFLARKRAPKYGIDIKTADDLMFWLVIGGFAGARIYHILSSLPYYLNHPLETLAIWNGGLSIFGAILGGVITLFLLSQILNLKSKILNYLDWLAPSVLLGQIIGRFGNLFNYEAFGYPTNLPWKMFVPANFRPLDFIYSQYFHPLFLYEALGNAIILYFLLKYSKYRAPGVLFFLYLMLYNILRFFLEFLRTDSTFIGIFRLNSIASFCLGFVSLGFLIYLNKNAKAP